MTLLLLFQLLQTFMISALEFGTFCVKKAQKLLQPSIYTQSIARISEIQAETVEERGVGAVLGALVGEAAGIRVAEE